MLFGFAGDHTFEAELDKIGTPSSIGSLYKLHKDHLQTGRSETSKGYPAFFIALAIPWWKWELNRSFDQIPL